MHWLDYEPQYVITEIGRIVDWQRHTCPDEPIRSWRFFDNPLKRRARDNPRAYAQR